MQKSIDATGRVVTRTAATEKDYLKLFKSFERRAGTDDLVLVVEWVLRMRTGWNDKTVRRYRAACLFVIDLAVDSKEIIPVVAQRLRELFDTVVVREGTLPDRTSGLKRRSIPVAEWERLLIDLGKGKNRFDELLRRIVFWGPILGLRPCEYCGATFVAGEITVKNAKATNGRGNGTFRTLVGDFSESQKAELNLLFAELTEMETVRGNCTAAWEPLRAGLTRACRRIGIAAISPYTLRHIAIATDKRALTQRELAARHGHKSTRSAAVHYARKSSGWKALPVERPMPTLPAIGTIVESDQASRAQNIASRSRKKASVDLITQAPEISTEISLEQAAQIKLDILPVSRSRRGARKDQREQSSPRIFHTNADQIVEIAERMRRSQQRHDDTNFGSSDIVLNRWFGDD